ncbi:MAG: hypothetical protein U0894_02185 [Pirellulales bacterium]
MRRESFELSVGKPRVITRKGEDGTLEEPFESLVVEVLRKAWQRHGTCRGVSVAVATLKKCTSVETTPTLNSSFLLVG